MPVTSARIAAICAAALLFSALPARTTPTVVFTCAGTIAPGSIGGPLDASVRAGTPFTATFALDMAAQDLNYFSANAWSYFDHNPLNEAYVQFGNYLLTPDPTSYALNATDGADNSGPLDIWRWGSQQSAGNGLKADLLLASLQDNTGTALTGKGLPPPGPGQSDISRWNAGELSFWATDTETGQRAVWFGPITSISTRVQDGPVPEPGTLSLLTTAGALGLALLAFRRRNAQPASRSVGGV